MSNYFLFLAGLEKLEKLESLYVLICMYYFGLLKQCWQSLIVVKMQKELFLFPIFRGSFLTLMI